MANKTTFYVRIYSRHDHDLMMYYLSLCSCEGTGSREFSKVLKTVLMDYARKRKSQIPIVKTQTDIIPKGSLKIRFTLDNKKDADVIKILRSVYKRQMNSFIKNLLRSRVEESQLESYFRTSEKAALAVVNGVENRTKRIISARHEISARKNAQVLAKEQKMNAEEAAKDVNISPDASVLIPDVPEVPEVPDAMEVTPKVNYNNSFVSTPAAPQRKPDSAPAQTESPSGFNIFGALEQAMNFGQ